MHKDYKHLKYELCEVELKLEKQRTATKILNQKEMIELKKLLEKNVKIQNLIKYQCQFFTKITTEELTEIILELKAQASSRIQSIIVENESLRRRAVQLENIYMKHFTDSQEQRPSKKETVEFVNNLMKKNEKENK